MNSLRLGRAFPPQLGIPDGILMLAGNLARRFIRMGRRGRRTRRSRSICVRRGHRGARRGRRGAGLLPEAQQEVPAEGSPEAGREFPQELGHHRAVAGVPGGPPVGQDEVQVASGQPAAPEMRGSGGTNRKRTMDEEIVD